VEGVLRQHPDSARLNARAATADVWVARTRGLRGWLADAPALSMRYQSDRWNTDQGLTEYEAGVLLPLWTPAQRQRSRSVSHALTGEVQATAERLRWEAAGTARELVWQLAEAEAALHSSLEAAGVREHAANAMQRRHAVGDAARKDVLLSEADRLAGSRRVIDTRAAVADAARRYRAITGLSQRPGFEAETVSAQAAIDDDHPLIAWAMSRLRSARAEHAAAERNASGNPALLIGPRRERGVDTNRYETSVGMTLTVPLPAVRLTRSKTAASAEAVADAQATLLRARRDLSLSLHEAEHELHVVEAALQAAGAEHDAARQVYDMSRRAFEAGELPLAELLRLQTSWLEAAERLALLDVRRNRTISAYNQATGNTP
jgi:outer membrane protein TolC